MVATNEFEDAWMDEGINSYTEVKVLDSILGTIHFMSSTCTGTRWATRAASGSLHYRGLISIPMAQKAYDYVLRTLTAALPTARPLRSC